MLYRTSFSSPIGTLTLYSDGTAITAITMPSWRFQPPGESIEFPILPVFRAATAWLENYFTGTVTESFSSISIVGTPFQLQVWTLLQEIPYGTACTYGEIARKLEKATGHRTSPRAVGHAVGCNPIAVLIPCHRVLGAGNKVTGFSGGLPAKQFLLDLEGIHYRH